MEIIIESSPDVQELKRFIQHGLDLGYILHGEILQKNDWFYQAMVKESQFEFQFVAGKSIRSFEENVKKALKEGWKIQGEVIQIKDSDGYGNKWIEYWQGAVRPCKRSET